MFSQAKEGTGVVEMSISVRRSSEKPEQRIHVKRPRFTDGKTLTEAPATVKCTSKDSSDAVSGISLVLPCLSFPATYSVSITYTCLLLFTFESQFLASLVTGYRLYNENPFCVH